MTCNGGQGPADRAGIRLLFLPAICLLLLPALLACDNAATSSPGSDSARTLASLRQVDGYPLFVMRYYGDYESPARSMLMEADAEGAYFGCTTFAALGGEPLLGRNFDWQNHMALLLFTDPGDGLASVSMVDISYLGFVPGDESDANRRKLLDAPRLPFDGMNEKGLAVGMMAVPHAEGGNDPAKPSIGSLGAIRLILDHAASVQEAAELLAGYNIDFSGGPPVHYLVSDAGRHAAVLEFLGGALTAIPADTLWHGATNFVVSECAWTGSPSDCWRYNRTLGEMRLRGGVIEAGEAIELLSSVSQPNTMWSVVYGAGRVLVAAGRRYDNVHTFTMDELRAMD